MGGEARSAPFGLEEPRKMGARSARACTRGQNPLVSETFPNEMVLWYIFFFIFWGAQNVAHFLKLKIFEWAELAVMEAAMDVTNICFI